MPRGRKPAKSKEAKPTVSGQSARDEHSRLRDLEKRLAEALQRERAAGEVLRVISSSPTDLQPVLHTIVKSAVRFCGAQDATIAQLEGAHLRAIAHHGPIPVPIGLLRQVVPGSVGGRCVLERRVIHTPDILAAAEEFPETAARVREYGYRTLLCVPLLRDGAAIGAIRVRRKEVAPFTDQQISLLQIFADQAVIAIENVRLSTAIESRNRDVTTALEQQTATREILSAIAASPIEIQSLLDTIVRSAAQVCNGTDVSLGLVEGDTIRRAAHFGELPVPAEFEIPLDRRSMPGRAIVDRETIQVDDARALSETEYPVTRELERARRARFGHRSAVATPLLRNGVAIGHLFVRRTEVRAFTNSEIMLLKTFADQAVIAIENVRLFTELQEKNRALTQAHEQISEAFERQTATADILSMISRSPTDVQPVFDAIVESAVRLCDGVFGTLFQFDGELIHQVAQHNYTAEALEGARRLYPCRPSRAHGSARAILERGIVHIPDNELDPEFRVHALSRAVGWRSGLFVPMLREGAPVGVIAVSRAVPGPFSDTEIELLQTFADQAVIAIENVRLFNEIKEALERQTATSAILGVISQSQTDTQPVFEAIADSALRLFRAWTTTVFRIEGESLLPRAARGGLPGSGEASQYRQPLEITRESVSGRCVVDRAVVHVADVQADADAPSLTREIAPARGFRAALGVPLLRDAQAIGSIAVSRVEPGPFSDSEIALLQTFADQAVIAIENVRLFTELQEKNRALTDAHAQVSETLERQTATSEILRVIASSPTDLQPVLDAVAERAARLCGANDALIFSVDGDVRRVVAHFGSIPIAVAPEHRLSRGFASGRAILERRTIHFHDVLEEMARTDYEPPDFQRDITFRTVLATPLLREDTVVGAITIRRSEVRPFTDEQIALLQTFADQAVIAIENVRLFNETKEALERQTATAEILGVISSSPTDVTPVFQAIARRATRLCDARFGTVFRYDGERITVGAHHDLTAEEIAVTNAVFPSPATRETAAGRAIVERRVVHIPDIRSDPDYRARAPINTLGYRTALAVPMLREGHPIGVFVMWRREVRPFTDKHIELVKTFADQAVIAIENVRLFTELQARTHELTRSVGQLTALGEVGHAVSSTLDLQTVLTTIVARATQLAEADAGVIYEYDEQRGLFEPRATERLEEDLVLTLVATPIRKGEGATGQLAVVREPIQVADVRDRAQTFQAREVLVRAGYRAALAVPLVREDRLLGGLTVFRKTPGEFAPEVVDLLRTFATQSALAIQNARLFREIEDKSRQLEVASQHKSEFLANMSHELRTPLNAIIGFSEVLSERMFGELNEKQEEYSKDIHASGQHLLSLINDILDLSKIEAGRMELELSAFHLPTALDNALTLVRERAGRRGIALQMNVDSRLGQIQADERKVRQVVLNLLSNAIKFTPEGGRIEVGAMPKGGFVELSVRDNGVGIAPEDQEAVFEEFRQVGTADKKVEGTGLGLTLCRKFVELHGGRIWVKSQVGAGSTFTFTIPVRHGE